MFEYTTTNTGPPVRSVVPDIGTRVEHANRWRWSLAGWPSADGPLQDIPISLTPFHIGSRPDSSLRLTSRRVSSAHAELYQDGRKLVLRDAGSRNGTFVNGNPVSVPVELFEDDLVQFAEMPFLVMKRADPNHMGMDPQDVVDEAIVLLLFDRLLSEQAMVPYYQPIVELDGDAVVGFEALARSNSSELWTPSAMFSAAAQLGLEGELSRVMRLKAVQETSRFQAPPHLFLNTHPAELEGPELIESMRKIRALNESQEITLEIHEKAVIERSQLRVLQRQLKDLHIRLAFDDFGAGQARLLELVDIHPEYLKFDMSLIRDVHIAPREHRRLLESLVRLSNDVGAVALAEGIECEAERDACLHLGFQLAQGFFFGHPLPLTESLCGGVGSSGHPPTPDDETDVPRLG